MKCGVMSSCTSARDPVTQAYPEFAKKLCDEWTCAFSMSASLNIRVADLLPNSSVHLFKLLRIAASCTFLPAPIDPVKLILAIPLCEASSAPVLPAPVMKFATPGGKPASMNSPPQASAPEGDFSDAL